MKTFVRRVLPALAVLAAASALAYVYVDARAARLCEALALDSREPLVKAVTELGKPLAWIWLLLVWSWAARRPRVLIGGIIAMLLVLVLVTPLKLAFHRIRPDEVNSAETQQKDFWLRSYSYPSGDTALAAAMAVVAAAALPAGVRWLPFFIAVVIACERMMVLRHYCADVLGGMLVGIAAGYWGWHLARRVLARGPPEWWRAACGAGAAAFLLGDATSHHSALTGIFLPWFGPVIVFVLAAVKGPAWLRWAGTPAPESAPCAPRSAPCAPSSAPWWRGRATGAVLVIAVAMAALPSLQGLKLFDRDEGYYGECAREMSATGDWIVPHFSGQPWLEKPPLTYWMMALGMAQFGPTEFAVRLPSALCALAAIYMTFVLGRMMYGARAGVIAAVITAGSVFFQVVMRIALLDMALVACATLAMIGLWLFLNGRGRLGLALFYAGCGLGVLAKGPLGLALPVIALAGYAAWSGRWRALWQARPVTGALIVLAVAGGWAFLADYQTQGMYFHELVWVRTIQPIFSPLQGHGGAGLAQHLALLPAYVPILLGGLLPWTVFLAPALRRAGGENWRGPRPSFLFGWIAAQLAVFSVIATKLPHYVLPLVPALAIVMGAYLAEVLGRGGRLSGERWPKRAGAILIAVGVLLAGAVLAAPVALGFAAEWPWFAPGAAAALIGMGWAGAAMRRGRTAETLARLAAVMALAMALVWQFGLPRFDAGKSSWRVAAELRRLAGGALDQARIGRLDYKEVSVVFYLQRPVEEVSGKDGLSAFLSRSGPAAVIVPEQQFRKDRPDPDAPCRVLWSTRAWILEKGSWTTLLIVGNDAFAALQHSPAPATKEAAR